MNIVIVSQSGKASGWGRVADEVGIRLAQRGHGIFAASFGYDEMLPPTMDDGRALPYHVANVKRGSMAHIERLADIIVNSKPDVVLVIEDFPETRNILNAPIDWSAVKLGTITAVDGAPISPRWVKVMRQADVRMVISEFGVEAWREAGVQVGLCPPGVNADMFYKRGHEERKQLREALGLSAEAFVVGSACTNFGRKLLPNMMRAFDEFAKDKPEARYLLDTPPQGMKGWDLRELCQMYGWDAAKILWRDDERVAALSLAERYNVLDAHMVLSSREGFGLPLIEAMACGAVSIAMDYCSGPEIVGEGRGMLIECEEHWQIGTWAGAIDRYPRHDSIVSALNALFSDKSLREKLSAAGMAWARKRSWDATADAVESALQEAVSA